MKWASLRGLVAIDKPVGPSSHDIINRLRRLTGVKRIGHAGTLDPFASGVLVVGISREATRELDRIVKTEKEYLAMVRLGATSNTDDRTGKLAETIHPPIPPAEVIAAALQTFVGTILQTPPAFSAIKQQGMKAYTHARKGKPLTLEPREVEVKSIELLDYAWPDVTVRIVCGAGVYIRALARDLGATLKTGGYVQELRRTRVGTYDLSQTLRLPDHPKDRGFGNLVVY